MTEEKKVVEEKTEVAEPKKEEAAAAKPDVKLSKESEGIVQTIESMSVLELSNLVKVLEDKFGVSASMPMMAIAAPGAGSGAGAAEEEKTSFTVELASIGPNKIQVIKEVRAITSLGLKEAKDLVDSAPKAVKEGVTKEEAEEIKTKLTAVGATIELK